MIKTNWHTHTARCGHAVGSDEEYVQAAIQAGITTLGFSDHTAYAKSRRTDRMDLEQFPEYMASITALKEKYKDQINIYLGTEIECYPEQLPLLKEYRKKMDYCILGQHSLDLDDDRTYFATKPEELQIYVSRLAYACQHDLCDYICHPDVVLWSYPVLDGSVRECAKQIAALSKKYSMPLELNTGSGVHHGLRQYEDGQRYAYPTRIFFEEFAKEKCPIIIGLDVHDPKLFLDDTDLNRALSVIEGLDCNILYDYDLIADAKKRKQNF
jgi:histidinol-phosphatase (PHP family)